MHGMPTSRGGSKSSCSDPRSFWKARVDLLRNSGIDGRSNCAGATADAGGGPRPDGTVTVAASFCDGASLMSHVNGSLDTVGGMADPRFHALLRQVIADLLPMPARRDRGGIRLGA